MDYTELLQKLRRFHYCCRICDDVSDNSSYITNHAWTRRNHGKCYVMLLCMTSLECKMKVICIVIDNYYLLSKRQKFMNKVLTPTNSYRLKIHVADMQHWVVKEL